MKLLLTVIDKSECFNALRAGCDILDIKNPKEGSLGAALPWVISGIKRSVPASTRLSIALGDIFYLPGTIALAVLGAAQFKPDYLKVGLKGIKSKLQAKQLLSNLVKTTACSPAPAAKLVAAGYAEYDEIGSIPPVLIPKIAFQTGARVAMVDTFNKNGRSILEIMPLAEIKRFIDQCHKYRLMAALAGGLTLPEVDIVRQSGVDIIGVRGAVCCKNKRTNALNFKLAADFSHRVKHIIAANTN